MTKRPSRAARIATAALIAATLAVGASACSFATADVTSPAAGVNASSDGVHVMNVLLVDSGHKASLIASVVSSQDDTLVSVSGTPITVTGSQGQPFATVQVNRGLAANQLVNLDSAGITLSSPDLVDGLTAQVTFTFSNAGEITVDAPVTSASNPVYSSAAG